MTKDQFEEQVLALANTMYRVSSGLLASIPDRHDAMQSSLLKAWQHRNKLRDQNRFRAWLIRILINECHTILRKSKNTLYVEVPEQSVELPDHSWSDAIMKLPEKYRMVVILHYVEQVHVNETAQILGIPSGTVKSRLSRARQLLVDELREEV